MGALPEVRILDAVDVGLVAFLLWLAIVVLRRSGATLALVGFAFLGLIYLAALRFQFPLTASLLRAFFAVFVIVLVVVFQDDLRRMVEQLGVWGLRRRAPTAPETALDVLVRSVTRLIETRRGALLVLPGREPLERHLEGGVKLDARLSEPLLLSLFDPNSPGHDGAVLIQGDRIARFAVHLPLSDNRGALRGGGTRHAAALGLAEQSDSLVVVVSEERGVVSLARDGQLTPLPGPEALSQELRQFAAGTAPAPRGAVRGIAARWPEALVAVVAAAAMWLVVVPGASVGEVERQIPVVVENLPEGFELEKVSPSEVTVVIEGRRSRLVLADMNETALRVDALLVQLGRRTFTVGPSDVQHPKGLRVLDVSPSQIRLSVKRPGNGS
ncbi:MAG: DNA integrity scanning protein DisA nucleotide-binding domain protein [Deltaproteobacteria bacterium]|nr:DNA integrity scanning protein DisA nucleotide-binding domain protein [Deltaproteobacteria bacterium]